MLPKAAVHIFYKAGNPWGCWQIFGSDCVLRWTAWVPRCYGSKGKRWKSYVSMEDVCVERFLSGCSAQQGADRDPLFTDFTLSASLCCCFGAILLAGWQGQYCYTKTCGKISMLLQWQWVSSYSAKHFCLLCILAPSLSAELLRFLAVSKIDAKIPGTVQQSECLLVWAGDGGTWSLDLCFLGGSLAGRA